MLATELVPYLGERYRLTDDPAHRALTGVRGFGLTSVFGVVAHPDVFGRAGAQSPFLGDVARHAFFEELAADAPENARFYVDWNRYEEVDPDLGVDFGADARALRSALETAGCDVSGGEVLDCHGWKSWSARLDAMLVALFGG
jgi:enterochelin esterase family protein